MDLDFLYIFSLMFFLKAPGSSAASLCVTALVYQQAETHWKTIVASDALCCCVPLLPQGTSKEVQACKGKKKKKTAGSINALIFAAKRLQNTQNTSALVV